MPEEPHGRHPARERGRFGSANSIRPLAGLRSRWVSRSLWRERGRFGSANSIRPLAGLRSRWVSRSLCPGVCARSLFPPCNYWSAAQQGLVYDWIAQGARGDFDGSPQSDIVFLDGAEGTRL